MSVAAPIAPDAQDFDAPATTDRVHHVPIDEVLPAPDNPRRQVGDVTELAETIAAVGILEPLIVTPAGADNAGRWLVVAGHRRLAAAHVAKQTTVPCLVRMYSDAERLEAMAIENLQREDLSPVEEGLAFKQLLDQGISQRDLSERVGRSQAHISKRVQLLELPDVAQDAVYSGGITLENAQDLLKIKNRKKIASVLKEATRTKGKGSDATTEFSEYDFKWALERALSVQDRIAKADASRKKLKDDGVKVVKAPTYGDKKVVELGRSHGNLGISVKDHKDESCHVGFVDYDGSASYACTDVGLHKRAGASQVKGKIVGYERSNGLTKEEREEQKELQRRRSLIGSSQKKRFDHYAALVKRRVDRDELIYLITLSVTVDLNTVGAQLDQIVKLLSLKASARRDWRAPDPALKVLATYAANSKENKARLAFARSLLDMESGIDSWAGGRKVDKPWADVAPFFTWLEKTGYELLPIEKELVRGEKPTVEEKKKPAPKKTTRKKPAPKKTARKKTVKKAAARKRATGRHRKTPARKSIARPRSSRR